MNTREDILDIKRPGKFNFVVKRFFRRCVYLYLGYIHLSIILVNKGNCIRVL